MIIREKIENNEINQLSKFATFSINTKGRVLSEEKCNMRTEFQRDRDRILHSKAFRRLKHKTQVFLAPEGDHYRTRLTHTLEVSQIARTIARALSLNEDLTESIALGHDLGHTPFGHAGESALNIVCSEGFTHFEQSVRIVEIVEKKGRGLNLTYEVKDGILNHRTSSSPSTLEGKVVRLSDKIAYINHDIDDAIRANILKNSDIPKEYTYILGTTIKERLNTLISDIVYSSLDKEDIYMSNDVEIAMKGIRAFMFSHVYTNKEAKGEEEKAKNMLASLYEHYLKNLSELPEEYQYLIDVLGESEKRVVCDYIAGMSDRYAVNKFQEIYIPVFWKKE